MLHKMQYRLALNLGTASLGWAMIRLNANCQPCAVIKAGARIFPTGISREKSNNTSLAAIRRAARSIRRCRDRLLKRKAAMIRCLIEHNFFPKNEPQRKALETLNPYYLRAKGLDEMLSAAEFGRALFHINLRRGFKSNRKTDKKDNDSGALKTAINKVRTTLTDKNCRTIGEWLYQRHEAGRTVRARYRQNKITGEDGKTKIEKSYDLYIDRAMIETEFEALWRKQAEFNPAQFTEAAYKELKNVLLHQRPLQPVKPGRCTFLPDEERAPLALPSTQRFRIYQEVNHLRILRSGLKEEPLTLEQRDKLVQALEENSKRSFTQMKKLLGIGSDIQFNFEDPKREELKGNITSAILVHAKYFGRAWFSFDESRQDAIVLQLLNEENEAKLVRWLQNETGVDEERAQAIAKAGLPPGYGSLCQLAIARILLELRRDVIPYNKAVVFAGFEHHSDIGANASGEIFRKLPYYGLPLRRHVGFGSDDPNDIDEKRYGRIANPTVHIGLNQIRLLANTLIERYGHPVEVIVEVARELKHSKRQRDAISKQQADNQKRNKRLRVEIAAIQQITEERVKGADIQKMILWEELSFDPADRRCAYSGIQISAHMVLSNEVEINYILPFSRTLDDSLNNKTVAMRQANRIKGNATPWEAFGAQSVAGFDYASMLERAEHMPKAKRYRFGQDGYEKWLKDDAGFLPRVLNDTRHMSVVARDYLSLICPQTRVIPGQMTAMLRAKFGLNGILSLESEKNRNDHRHSAVDACVIGVTDQDMLQRFAKASADARGKQLNRLVEDMPLPWDNYKEHVTRAINSVWVSHKPDHNYEGSMLQETAYGLRENGKVVVHKMIDGKRTLVEQNLKVIGITCTKATQHGLLPDGTPRPYKGYASNSNYCIEIVRGEKGKWESVVLSTFEAYQLVRQHGIEYLRKSNTSLSGKPLVMRLMINDNLRIEVNATLRTMRVVKIGKNGQIFMADVHEANVAARDADKENHFSYISKYAASLQKAKGRRISISPIGVLRDPGFSE